MSAKALNAVLTTEDGAKWVFEVELSSEVIPTGAVMAYLPSKLEITLPKAHASTWGRYGTATVTTLSVSQLSPALPSAADGSVPCLVPSSREPVVTLSHSSAAASASTHGAAPARAGSSTTGLSKLPEIWDTSWLTKVLLKQIDYDKKRYVCTNDCKSGYLTLGTSQKSGVRSS